MKATAVCLQLWVKQKDMPDTLCAAAEFPSADLVDLAASAAATASTEGPSGILKVASRSIALPLALSESVQQQAAPALPEEGNARSSGTVLHVQLRYSAAACAGSTAADVSAPVSRGAAADAKGDGQTAAAAPEPSTHWTINGAEADGSAIIDLGSGPL